MELSGRTDVLPLFDLVQMLSVNEATGMLKVEAGEEKGYLYLQDGSVINALDGERREGEEAAKHVFSLENAEYAFAPELPSVAHLIHCSTQSLMMDIARQLDEDGTGEGEEPTHGERVREAQEATRALQEIFEQLDVDSRVLSLRSHQGFAVTDLLDSVRDAPGAVLCLRDGAPPAARDGDLMVPLGDLSVDARGYAELRDLLLRGAVPLGPPGPDADAYLVSVGSHGRFRIEIVRWGGTEMLTARAAPDEADLAELLPWPAERLDSLLAHPGSVVLLTAATRSLLTPAFESVAAHLLTGELGPLLGLARRWNPGPSRPGTALLSTLHRSDRASARAIVDRLEPAIVVVEDSDCRPALGAALRALRGGSRALIGVCAPSAAHVVHRFLDGMSTEGRRSWAYHLGTGLGAVLAADGTVVEVADEARAPLMTGDVAALVQALTDSTASEA